MINETPLNAAWTAMGTQSLPVRSYAYPKPTDRMNKGGIIHHSPWTIAKMIDDTAIASNAPVRPCRFNMILIDDCMQPRKISSSNAGASTTADTTTSGSRPRSVPSNRKSGCSVSVSKPMTP